MAEKSKIEWTDATWNPLVGCSLVSPACTNCYAMAMADRIQRMAARGGYTNDFSGSAHYIGTTNRVNGKPVWTGKVALAPGAKLLEPLRWKKPRRIFVNSMSDLFHESVPDEWLDRIFAVMALAPQHTFQVLTKRAARMRAYMERRTAELATSDLGAFLATPLARACVEISRAAGHPLPGNAALELCDNSSSDNPKHVRRTVGWPPRNVWLGVTAERQEEADARIPDLLATPAAVRFVSVEPMLGPVDLTDIPWPRPLKDRFAQSDDLSDSFDPLRYESDRHGRLDWVICGGESGRDARPMHPDWARSLRDQCAAASVPFFFKQRGEWSWPEDPMLPSFDEQDETTPELPEDWRERDHGVICMRSDGTRTLGYSADDSEFLFRVGKSRAGRLLDGIEHNGFPEAREA